MKTPLGWIIMLVCVVLTSQTCVNPFWPDSPYQAFTAPTAYKTEWDWTWQNCGSKFKTTPDRAYTKIHWYKTYPESGGRTFTDSKGLDVWGVTSIAAGNIFVTDFSSHIKFVIRHEMLHLQIGARGHPPIFEECNLTHAQHPDVSDDGQFPEEQWIAY